MQKPNFDQWIGKTETKTGRLGEDLARMMHATVGVADTDAPGIGQAAPSLWHWTAFNPKAPLLQLAEDGHPVRGDFLPPVNLPRRMWAGGAVHFHTPVHVGHTLKQVSMIRAVEEKTETMTLVTLDHEIYDQDTLAITEMQNIVYLEIPKSFSPPKQRPAPETPAFSVPVNVSERLLFRYSAVTFNAHRIHYDLDYTKNVEKYPGLVVHAPLQATLLLGAGSAHSGKLPGSFVYRGVHPMFDTDDIHLMGSNETPDGMELCTGVPGGHQGLHGTVKWKD